MRVDGHPQLRADTVGAGDQERVLVVSLEQPLVVVQAEDAGKVAVLAEDARPVGPPDGRPDALDEPVAGLDVDAGRFVGQALCHASLAPGGIATVSYRGVAGDATVFVRCRNVTQRRSGGLANSLEFHSVGS